MQKRKSGQIIGTLAAARQPDPRLFIIMIPAVGLLSAAIILSGLWFVFFRA